MDSHPMTAPADRCPRCDRSFTECGEAAAYDRYWHFRGDAMGRQGPLDAWLALSSACRKAAIDWRAEALASRALLREAERGIAITGPRSKDLALLERIREHLREKP